MNVEHFNHIAMYRNVHPDGYCQHLINEFERLASEGAGSNRQKDSGSPKHSKDDYFMFIQMGHHNMVPFEGHDPVRMFFDGLQDCYNEYTNKYSTLQGAGSIKATHMKLQRTQPGGGYHIWHAEQGPNEQAGRVLTYMLYLNTLAPEEAGETEFLYQEKRIKTEENALLLWPSAFTHTHRGNAVYGKTYKYVATGWFYFN